MPKHIIDCPECDTHVTITAKSNAPVQCCPFCGNTVLPDDDDVRRVGADEEDDDETDNDYVTDATDEDE